MPRQLEEFEKPTKGSKVNKPGASLVEEISKEDIAEMRARDRTPIEVTDRSKKTPAVTDIPEALTEYFHGLGKQLLFVRNDVRSMMVESTYERHPVLVDDLPEELKKVCRGAFMAPERNYGELHRGDCILVSQSYDARDFWREQHGKAQEAADAYYRNLADNVTEETERRARDKGVLGRRGMVEVRPDSVGPLSDHVTGGPEIQRMIQETPAERR